MNKEHADKIITKYMKKIYGFAVSKVLNIDEAEDLASMIVFEVYKALLQAGEIYNMDKYIFRISSNVYSRFVIEEIKGNQALIDKGNKPFDNELSRDKTYSRLRNEIAYLSNLEREIVILYYFQKLKVKDIAEKLNSTPAKIKWHLFEARNQLKDSFNQTKHYSIYDKDNCPITFSNMRHFGTLGPQSIDMDFYLSKRLTQNILYAAYQKAKTSVEIAKELNIPVVFVEDEIKFLVNSGFINKKPNNKFLSNIFIYETNKDDDEKYNQIFGKYAKLVCEKYVPLLMENVEWKMENGQNVFCQNKTSSNVGSIYVPNNDRNFLMWSIVTYACWRMLTYAENKIDISKYFVQRLDGGSNIAIAAASNDIHSRSANLRLDDKGVSYDCSDIVSENFTKTKTQISAWQFFSKFDDRSKSYPIWTNLMFETLYHFITGKITNEPESFNKLMPLFEKGYLIAPTPYPLSPTPYPLSSVNMLILNMTETDFLNILPKIPDDLSIFGKELDNEMYELSKSYFPPHKQDLYRITTQNSLRSGKLRVFILEHLLKTGKLKPLKKHQRQTVNMMMFVEK